MSTLHGFKLKPNKAGWHLLLASAPHFGEVQQAGQGCFPNEVSQGVAALPIASKGPLRLSTLVEQGHGSFALS